MKRPNIRNTAAVSASLLTIVAPKFCCWSSAIAAVSGGASYLAWVYPMRPYLFGLSFVFIGYSFYKAYRPKKEETTDCVCNKGKSNFLTSKRFTWLTAVFVFTMFIVSYFINE